MHLSLPLTKQGSRFLAEPLASASPVVVAVDLKVLQKDIVPRHPSLLARATWKFGMSLAF